MTYIPVGPADKEIWVPQPLSWENTGVSSPTHRGAVFRVGATLYMFGGEPSNGSVNTIYSAAYDASGTVPLFADTGATLPGTAEAQRIALIGSTLYMYGSSGSFANNNIGSTSIWSAPLTTPTVWSNTGAVLPERRDNARLVVCNDRIALIGGNNGTAALATARVYDVATPTSASYTKTIAVATESAAVFTKGGHIYFFGGVGTATYMRGAPISRFCTGTTAFTWEETSGLATIGIGNNSLAFDCHDEVVIVGHNTNDIHIGKPTGGNAQFILRNGGGAPFSAIIADLRDSHWIGGDGRAYFINGSSNIIWRSGRRKVYVRAADYAAAQMAGAYVGMPGTLEDGSPSMVTPHVLMGVAPWQTNRTLPF